MWTLRCFNTCVHRCSLSWVELSCIKVMVEGKGGDESASFFFFCVDCRIRLWAGAVYLDVIYHFLLLLLTYIRYLWPIGPISPMQCFYRPAQSYYAVLPVSTSKIIAKIPLTVLHSRLPTQKYYFLPFKCSSFTTIPQTICSLQNIHTTQSPIPPRSWSKWPSLVTWLPQLSQ